MAFIIIMIKKYRIKKNEEFSKIVAYKKSIASDCFVVYCKPKNENYSRIGISVSKKLGNAVIRNKIKRQIRMMIADFYDFDNSDKDFIIIARKKYLDKSFKDNMCDLEKLIKSSII